MSWITQYSSKKDVELFLKEMHSLLEDKDFNMDTDFLFQEHRAADEPDDEFTNENTLLALHYDSRDVINELKTLTIDNYSESMVDSVSPQFNILYVFGKIIKERDIYIKVRIKKRRVGTKFVFCLSFHFARNPISYRYKRK